MLFVVDKIVGPGLLVVCCVLECVVVRQLLFAVCCVLFVVVCCVLFVVVCCVLFGVVVFFC